MEWSLLNITFQLKKKVNALPLLFLTILILIQSLLAQNKSDLQPVAPSAQQSGFQAGIQHAKQSDTLPPDQHKNVQTLKKPEFFGDQVVASGQIEVQDTLKGELSRLNSGTPVEGLIVKEIIYKGLKGTKPWVVQREIQTQIGNRFSSRLWKSDLSALEKLDIFAEFNPLFYQTQDSVSIHINFKEIPLLVMHPTGEYTEENGLALGLGGISTNLWGRAHYFQPSFKQGLESGGISRASIEYGFPRFWGHRLQTQLWLAGEIRDNKLEGFKEEYRVARLTGNQTLVYHPDAQLQLRGEFWLESVGSNRDSVTLASQVCHCNKSDLLPSLGSALIFDSRDAGGNPRRGWYLEAAFMYTGGYLGGPASFPTFTLDTRRHQPLGTRFSIQLSQLVTWQMGSLGKSIPVYRRFWLGGANSIRGHEMGTAFGQNQALYNIEFQFLAIQPRAWPLGFKDLYIDLGLQPIAGLDRGLAWGHNSVSPIYIQESLRNDLQDVGWLTGYYIGAQLLVPYIKMVRFELGMKYQKAARLKVELAGHLAPHSRTESQRWRRK